MPLDHNRLIYGKKPVRHLQYKTKVQELMHSGGIELNKNIFNFIMIAIDRIENGEDLNAEEIKKELADHDTGNKF